MTRGIGAETGTPAIGDGGYAAKHWSCSLGTAAEPNGNGTLHGQGIYSGVADAVPAPLKIDHFFGPQGPHQRYLLFAASAPILKVLGEGLVFYVVPAHANAKAQPAAAQDVHFRGLLGHERCLPLGQNQDS